MSPSLPKPVAAHSQPLYYRAENPEPGVLLYRVCYYLVHIGTQTTLPTQQHVPTNLYSSMSPQTPQKDVYVCLWTYVHVFFKTRTFGIFLLSPHPKTRIRILVRTFLGSSVGCMLHSGWVIFRVQNTGRPQLKTRDLSVGALPVFSVVEEDPTQNSRARRLCYRYCTYRIGR
jgi:hypothetical protein